MTATSEGLANSAESAKSTAPSRPRLSKSCCFNAGIMSPAQASGWRNFASPFLSLRRRGKTLKATDGHGFTRIRKKPGFDATGPSLAAGSNTCPGQAKACPTMRCAQALSGQLSAFERHEIVAACKEYGGIVIHGARLVAGGGGRPRDDFLQLQGCQEVFHALDAPFGPLFETAHDQLRDRRRKMSQGRRLAVQNLKS